MNYKVLDIIHLWADSRGKLVHSVFPSKGKIYVYSTGDLGKEAAKVCKFIALVENQPWTFEKQRKNELYELTFFPETARLEDLFE